MLLAEEMVTYFRQTARWPRWKHSMRSSEQREPSEGGLAERNDRREPRSEHPHLRSYAYVLLLAVLSFLLVFVLLALLFKTPEGGLILF